MDSLLLTVLQQHQKIQRTWKVFSLKLEIIQKLEDLDRTEDNTVSLWEDIQAKSHEVNKVYFKQELEDFATKRLAVPAALGDIVQGAVLLVLLLRTDLRLRGTLGLAGLTNQLDIDSRDSNIPGCTLKPGFDEYPLPDPTRTFFCYRNPT